MYKLYSSNNDGLEELNLTKFSMNVYKKSTKKFGLQRDLCFKIFVKIFDYDDPVYTRNNHIHHLKVGLNRQRTVKTRDSSSNPFFGILDII